MSIKNTTEKGKEELSDLKRILETNCSGWRYVKTTAVPLREAARENTRRGNG